MMFSQAVGSRSCARSKRVGASVIGEASSFAGRGASLPRRAGEEPARRQAGSGAG
jgi:hypothetical protein